MTKKRFIKVLGLLLVVGLLFAALPSGQAQAATVVTTEAQLLAALADTGVTEIELGASFALSATVNVSRSVSIDGKDFTITGPTVYHGINVGANNVTIKNLTITGSAKSNLNFYRVTGGVVNNVVLANAGNAGMIVNGSQVTITNVTTTNNAWGGINVDQGSGVTETPLLTVTNVTTHTSPTTGLTPAIWVDTGNAAWVSAEGLYIVVSGTPLAFFDVAEYYVAFPPSEVWVCPTGSCGHLGVDYSTIQGGINAVASGGTVHVEAGTYNEGITLNKLNVTVKSVSGAASTFIDVPVASLTTGVTIVKDMGTVTFEGFTVQNFTESGIIQGMSQSSGTTAIIKNNVVTPASNYLRNGIQVTGNGSIVEGNTVNSARLTEDWASTGISVTNGSNIRVKNNVINGGATGVDSGIAILNYNVGSVSDITIEGNTIRNASEAVSIQGGPDTVGKVVSGVSILNNDFVDCEDGLGIGYVNLQGATVFEGNELGLTGNYIAIYGEGYPAWGYPGASVSGTIDASPNWYGSVAGPEFTRFYDDGQGTDSFQYTDPADFTYIPWCSVADCSQTAGPVTNVTQHKGYATIQAAIDDATAGDTIQVAAGTYAEDVDVTKAVTLLGPNAGTPGNGTRVDEAVIQGTNASWVSLYVEPDVPGVTIKGFKFDGVNLNPGTSYVVGVAGDSSGLTVQNNVFVNHNDMAIMTSGVYYDNGWKYDKWLTGILIKDNLITNPTPSTSGYNFGIYLQSSLGSVTGNVVTNMRNGIQVQPYWNTPGGGTISGNTFEAYRTGIYFNYTQNATADWDFTGNTVAGIAYPTGVDPVRFNAIRVETFSAGQVDFSYNQVLLGASNATEQYQYFETAVTGGTSSATPNWWGSILGPAAGKYSGTAAFDPWCGDAACTFLVSATEPAVSGFYVQDGKLILKGSINVTGGIVINEPLTILLKNGTVIQNSSPCFIVNSSNVTVTTESIGGAKCVPTNGANGIDVASALNNITIEGIEFDGTGQDTGDGIHFAGAIQDVVLVDNYLHDLDGDGIEFAGNVAEIVNIQGNMFKANGGSGINNLGANTVGAEYNSWGNVAGPAAGDGVSGLVTSTPFTHADLYLASSGTPWANQVVKGQNITYTVMAHLVNVNAADFVLTYPAELTWVSSDASGSMGTESVLHNATARTLQFIGYNTTNLSGDLPLFTVTFTGSTAVANAPLSFSYGTTSGFGMVGYESSNNVFVNEMVNGSVTVIDLPTISSTDIQGYYLTGEQREFHVTVDNLLTGGNYAHVIFQFNVTADAGDISLEYWTGAAWAPLPLTCASGVCSGYYGPAAGFPMPNPYNATSLFRATAAVPGAYPVEVKLLDLDTNPDTVLATYTNTAYVYDKALVTVATTDQYLIVGEPGAFTVTINNPTSGRNYDNSVVFDILIPSHAVSDFSALSCSITSPAPFTWDLLSSLVPDDAGGVKARIAGLDGYFEVPPTDANMVINCSVTVTTAGAYSASGNMVDVVDKVTPVERIVSDSVSLSTVAYLKPVITANNLGGPFDAGVPETVSLSIENASIPEPFEVVFNYPAGTVIVYNGVTYTCAATCPVIPVDLTAEPTVLEFTVTFDKAWTGDVSVGLYDSNWTPADRLLASASATNVVVSGGFAVTGTFSMQGNASRAGIPVTLTWGGTLVTYGPSAETSSAISNNFSVSVLYGGEYTITTLQPRYLNVTADLLKKITVAGPYNMSALLLRGGNAYWRVSDTVLDNIINSGDSSIVGTQYGSSGADAGFGNHGDCNFDGIVNIQDLALVGGNWSLTSLAAYSGTLPWVP